MSWLAVAPPLLAISLALATRKVVPALGVAIGLGALIMGSWEFVPSITHLGRYGWGAVTGSTHLGILSFSVLLGGLIGVMGQSGEQERLARLVTRYATTRTRGQISTWFLGLVIFLTTTSIPSSSAQPCVPSSTSCVSVEKSSPSSSILLRHPS